MAPSRTAVCASCRRTFDTPPVFESDLVYCCRPCAARHLCTCLVELDLADDGVNGLGLPFAVETPVTPRADREPLSTR